jgi:hypothetical protein
MAESPGRPEPGGCATGPSAGVGDERGHRDEMVGVGGVAKTKDECKDEDDKNAVAGGMGADGAVDPCHWTIH